MEARDFSNVRLHQVETYLEVFGYEQDDIPSDDRNQAIADGEDPDGLALIYGEDYDFLSAKFAEILSGRCRSEMVERKGNQRRLRFFFFD